MLEIAQQPDTPKLPTVGSLAPGTIFKVGTAVYIKVEKSFTTGISANVEAIHCNGCNFISSSAKNWEAEVIPPGTLLRVI